MHEVVARNQHARERGMLGIDAGIDYRHNTVAGGKLLLGLRQVNQRRTRLLHIPGTDLAAEVAHRAMRLQCRT